MPPPKLSHADANACANPTLATDAFAHVIAQCALPALGALASCTTALRRDVHRALEAAGELTWLARAIPDHAAHGPAGAYSWRGGHAGMRWATRHSTIGPVLPQLRDALAATAALGSARVLLSGLEQTLPTHTETLDLIGLDLGADGR